MSCTDCSNTINTLPTGSPGLDGASAYIYVATATNSSGANFALYADSPTQCWKAILVSPTEITSPQASDFADLWFNTCGTNGSNGTNGTNGREGVDGNNWIVGTVVPSTLYNDGDYYLNTVSGNIYHQESSAWVLIGNIKGPAGTNGTDGENGTTWTSGLIDPNSGADGVTIGDLYFNADTGDVYRWDGSTWSIISNIVGPTGSPGATGNTGPAGADGTPKTITSDDDTVTISNVDNNYDLSVKSKLNTFSASVIISNAAYASSSQVISVNTGTEGITDGQVIMDYNYATFNQSEYVYSSGQPYTDLLTYDNFGYFDSANGLLHLDTPGMYLVVGTIHLKSNDSTSVDWESSYSATNNNSFGLGIVDSSSTNLYCANYQTITNNTRQIDITTSTIIHVKTTLNVKLKVLNWTSRNYDGSGYSNADAIKLHVTQLTY